MFLLEAEELLDHTNNIVHEKTQKQSRHLDLTVSGIYRYTGSGSLDFGGSEFEPANTERIDPVKQSKNDDYGWWILKEASYKAVFNESLSNLEDTLVAITPHSHALQAGIVANTLLLSADKDLDSLSLNFRVPLAGCNIKENARFATLHIFAK